jgi:spoIIIJ-associated protein
MSERNSIEATGDSVDEAVKKGCEELGVSPGDVIVEVLDEPSRGVFGIGAKPARVRIQVLRRPMPPAPPAPPVQTTTPSDIEELDADAAKFQEREFQRRRDWEAGRDTRSNAPGAGNRNNRGGDRRGQGGQGGQSRGGQGQGSGNWSGGRNDRGGNRSDNRGNDRRGGQGGQSRGGQGSRSGQGGSQYADLENMYDDYTGEEEAYAFNDSMTSLAGVEDAPGEEGQLGKAVLLELLQHMRFNALVRVLRVEPTESEENPPWVLNVEGRDVTSLIGRRGDTLSSLQYITRLIASRQLGRRANIVVDVAQYKQNRSQKLRELAGRMADQAVRESRTVVLEPMPPHERRMIHMALRSREDVSTRSTGEGEGRKVTIIPK